MIQTSYSCSLVHVPVALHAAPCSANLPLPFLCHERFVNVELSIIRPAPPVHMRRLLTLSPLQPRKSTKWCLISDDWFGYSLHILSSQGASQSDLIELDIILHCLNQTKESFPSVNDYFPSQGRPLRSPPGWAQAQSNEQSTDRSRRCSGYDVGCTRCVCSLVAS